MSPMQHTEHIQALSIYCISIYCKSCSREGEVKPRLVTSKSRVPPMKRVTMLCVEVLLANLTIKAISTLASLVNKAYLCSDSRIAFSWLQKESYQLKTFVTNQVTTIQQELTNDYQWCHVSSNKNLSDLISHILDSNNLLQNVVKKALFS